MENIRSAIAHATAPAKINLFLHVTGRRDDGYHELDSLFVPLALADDLRLRISEGADRQRDGVVSCVVPAHRELDGENNLAARAATLYLQRAGISGVQIEVLIHKRIWVAAGLGGGSSDAAAVLRVLESHFGALGAAKLAELALQLGADVPFFLLGKPARAKGVGELLEAIEPSVVPRLELVLLNPGLPLSTPAVFSALGTLQSHGFGSERVLKVSTLEDLCHLVHNDLLQPALGLCPQIVEIMELLDTARVVGMTGSGPTVFGIYGSANEAREVVDRIQRSAGRPGIQAIATRSATG